MSLRLGSRMLSFVLDQIRPQHAQETLRRLPTIRAREVAESLKVPPPDTQLLAHSPDSAGALMVSQFPTVKIDGNAEAARDSVRALEKAGQKFTYVFVLNDGDELSGQVTMVDLAPAESDTQVRGMAKSIVATVTVDTPAAECARLRRHYNLTQIAVVDCGRLIGAILPESLMSAAVEHDTRPMLQVASVAGDSIDVPLTASIRTRLPWLTVNMATTFLAAATVGLFGSTLVQVVVLAAFLPVVAGQGGIGGTQTLTLIVRAIALGELGNL